MELTVERFYELTEPQEENIYDRAKGKAGKANYNPERNMTETTKILYERAIRQKGEFSLSQISKGLNFPTKSVRHGEWDRAKRLLHNNGYKITMRR